jgi:hypothetical protein
MKSKYSRKQMTPGMKKCKEYYGSKSGRIGTPFTAADAGLVQGASNIYKHDMNTTVGTKTGLETAVDLSVNEANRNIRKYGGTEDDMIKGSQYGYDSDQQIKENLDAGV